MADEAGSLPAARPSSELADRAGSLPAMLQNSGQSHEQLDGAADDHQLDSADREQPGTPCPVQLAVLATVAQQFAADTIPDSTIRDSEGGFPFSAH